MGEYIAPGGVRVQVSAEVAAAMGYQPADPEPKRKGRGSATTDDED